jgi:hypothetical protein
MVEIYEISITFIPRAFIKNSGAPGQRSGGLRKKLRRPEHPQAVQA